MITHFTMLADTAGAVPWGRLLIVLLGTAVFLCVVALFGRLLAATHPDAPARAVVPSEKTTPIAPGLTPELVAAISAAVHAALGARLRVTSIQLVQPPAPSVEALMQTWSLEGRRQIYSSHQIR